MDRDALVIGAGVVGLTSALRLAEDGWRVRVVADKLPEDTTSAVAAALWYPYRVGPADLVNGWGKRSFEMFTELAEDMETGVRMAPGVELLAPGSDPLPLPEWAASTPGARMARTDEVPPGRVGWAMTLPVVHMSIYLRWLVLQLERKGVSIKTGRVASLTEAAAEGLTVVNCTGLDARKLVDNETLVAVRGQVVRVENPGLVRFWLDDLNPEGLTYIIPRWGDCILGGTADEGQEDTTPDRATAEAILARCIGLEPALAGARVLKHCVGLRPERRVDPANPKRLEVCLEAEPRSGGGRVIHNYGHGGAGVTLSWGCADRVVELANG